MGAAPKKTSYVVFEKTIVQRVRIVDPGAPEEEQESTEVEAFIPVRGLGSGEPGMPANSGPEACRLYARERGVEGRIEEGDTLELRACSERNWSGTDVALELQISFADVVPKPRRRRSKSDDGDQGEPEPVEPDDVVEAGVVEEEPAAT